MCASRYFALAFLPLFSAVGVAAEPPANSSQRLDDLRKAGVKIASAKCETPAKVYSKIVTNRHSHDKDREITTLCGGRKVTIYKVTADPSVSKLTHLVIDQRQPGMPFGLNVGSGRDVVEKVLGAPSERLSEVLRYYVYYPTDDDEIKFHTRAGVVKEIEWHWNID